MMSIKLLKEYEKDTLIEQHTKESWSVKNNSA